jgi:hypothetical protein
MKSFKTFISEAIRQKNLNGDCYVAAYRLMSSNYKKDMKLVHGLVVGQGNLAGIRYNHAWVESDDIVYDYANGRKIELPKPLYYKIGKIKESDIFRYDQADMYMMTSKTGTYGPWERKLQQNKY